MINGEQVVCIIPASAPGSEPVVRDNRWLWAVAAGEARKSQFLDWFCVLCNDDKTIIHCKSLGYEFLKPEGQMDISDGSNLLRYLKTKKNGVWLVLLPNDFYGNTSEDIDKCIHRATLGWGAFGVGEDDKDNNSIYVVHSDWIENHDINHSGLAKYRRTPERLPELYQQSPEDFTNSDQWERGWHQS